LSLKLIFFEGQTHFLFCIHFIDNFCFGSDKTRFGNCNFRLSECSRKKKELGTTQFEKRLLSGDGDVEKTRVSAREHYFIYLF